MKTITLLIFLNNDEKVHLNFYTQYESIFITTLPYQNKNMDGKSQNKTLFHQYTLTEKGNGYILINKSIYNIT